MGKRKTKKVKPSYAQLAQKRRGKLDKEFLCHYCQHERAIAIKIDGQTGLGFLNCRICGVKFSTKITSLDEPIDVYTVWMDKCRESSGTVVKVRAPVVPAAAPQPSATKSVHVVALENDNIESRPLSVKRSIQEYDDLDNFANTSRLNRIIGKVDTIEPVAALDATESVQSELEKLQDLFSNDD